MSYRGTGKASVDTENPQGFGVCDLCGCWRNHIDLQWQYDWRGNSLQNIRSLRCYDTCIDTPQEQLRPVIIPPDPLPIRDPRVEPFALDYAPASNQTVLTNDQGQPLTNGGSPNSFPQWLVADD